MFVSIRVLHLSFSFSLLQLCSMCMYPSWNCCLHGTPPCVFLSIPLLTAQSVALLFFAYDYPFKKAKHSFFLWEQPLWRWIYCIIFSHFHSPILFDLWVRLHFSFYIEPHRHVSLFVFPRNLYSISLNVALYFYHSVLLLFSLPCCDWWNFSCSPWYFLVLYA